MIYLNNLCIVILIIKFLSIQAFKKYAQVLESIGTCTEPEYANMESPFTNVKLIKINHTAKTLSFDVNFLRPWDDKLSATMKVQKMSSGGLKEFPFLPSVSDPCNIFLKHFRSTWVPVMGALGVKHPDRCPIPVGKYAMDHYLLNFASSETNIFPMKGRLTFRVIVTDIATKKLIMCMAIVSNAVEE